MSTLKITTWNVEHLDRLTGGNLSLPKQRRRVAVAREIREIAPDILCVVEGPKSEAGIDGVAQGLLGGDYAPVKAADGQYGIRGTQWMWFLVRGGLADRASLLPISTWDALTGSSWTVHYWGDPAGSTHRHYRHPQVLVLNWPGLRVELIALHLKSKFVNCGRSMWEADGEQRNEFIEKAIRARIKMTTEASNVRAYVHSKFDQVQSPALFVLGDLNDGPGKEYFESQYLFFDLMTNVQGNVFQASKFLNHALFDYPDHLRWTVQYDDFIERQERRILLDHIMFTQPLCDGSLPWKINANAGCVEHEIHDLINVTLPSQSKTSDHEPVSCVVTVQE
jgi:hypothetical protein